MRPAALVGGGLALAAAAYSPFMRHRYLTAHAGLPVRGRPMGVDLLAVRAMGRYAAGEPQPDRQGGASIGRRLADRLIMVPGSLVMERKMLAGIRDGAESVAAG